MQTSGPGEGGPTLSKDLGVRDMCLLHVRSTQALSSSAGTHAVSDKNCVRVETRQWLNRSGTDHPPTPRARAHSSALESDIYRRWLINAQARKAGDSCVFKT